MQRDPVLCPCCGFVHGKARSVVAEGHNVTWQQGTSGKTVSPKLCAEERVGGGPAGGFTTPGTMCCSSLLHLRGANTIIQEEEEEEEEEVQPHEHASRPRVIFFFFVFGVRTRIQQRRRGRLEPPSARRGHPRGWEAETGPPLTSVGLSVSCNRKWERRWREKTQSCTPPARPPPLFTLKGVLQPAPVSVQTSTLGALHLFFCVFFQSRSRSGVSCHCDIGRCRRLQPQRVGHAFYPPCFSRPVSACRELWGVFLVCSGALGGFFFLAQCFLCGLLQQTELRGGNLSSPVLLYAALFVLLLFFFFLGVFFCLFVCFFALQVSQQLFVSPPSVFVCSLSPPALR